MKHRTFIYLCVFIILPQWVSISASFMTTTTSTFRPWPSSSFFDKVLQDSKQKLTSIIPYNTQTNYYSPSLQNLRSYNRSQNEVESSEHEKLNNYMYNSSFALSYKLSYPKLESEEDESRLEDGSKTQNQSEKVTSDGFDQNRKEQSYNQVTTESYTGINQPASELRYPWQMTQQSSEEVEVEPEPFDSKLTTPSIRNNYNYGIGFQYEIVQNKDQDIRTTTAFPTTVSTKSTEGTEGPPEDPHRYLEIDDPYPQNPSSLTSSESEGYNDWKKIPHLTVTVTPVKPANTNSFVQRTRKKKPAINHHHHFKYHPLSAKPHITKLSSTPSPLMTTAEIDFDTPLSPDPMSSLLPILNQHQHQHYPTQTSSLTPTRIFVAQNHEDTIQQLPASFSSPVSPHRVHVRPQIDVNSFRPLVNVSTESSGVNSLPHVQDRPLSTNIWYKPIINHFISSTSTNKIHKEKIPSHEQTFGGLLFKVWSYKNGRLTLVHENSIPSSALDGFQQLENGAILNLDQIPLEVQDSVTSALSSFNLNGNDPYASRDPYNFLPSTSKQSGDASNLEQILNKRKNSTRLKNSQKTGTKASVKLKSVNYIILDSDDKSGDSLPTNKLRNKLLAVNPKPENDDTDYDVEKDAYDEANQVPDPVTQDQAWQYLNNILLSVQNIRLPTPVHKDTDISIYQTSSESDSFQSASAQRNRILANLAAAAILIAHLQDAQQKLDPSLYDISQASSDTLFQITLTPPTLTGAGTNAIQIYQQLLRNHLQNSNATESKSRRKPIKSKRRKVQKSTLPSKLRRAKPFKSTRKRKSKKSKKRDKNRKKKKRRKKKQKSQKDKSLIIKGLVKKGIKKKIKKKKVAFLASLLSLFHKPKEYWFDFKLDVDLYDLLKKKFLYYLALKYFPVALIVSLKLVPLLALAVSLLWKVHWIMKKKKPKYKYIPIPVPYPKPYPIHHYGSKKSDHDRADSDPDIQKGLESSASGVDDLNVSSAFNHYHGEEALPFDINAHPYHATPSYNIGFNLGSKVNTDWTNKHDREVLKILFKNKREKVQNLLRKWSFFHKSGQTYSIQRSGYFHSAKNSTIPTTTNGSAENEKFAEISSNLIRRRKRKRSEI